MPTANAFPRKQFFLEMFTRDISLEDCILDLIDNSMDSLIRTRHIDIESEILRSASTNGKHDKPATITVRYSPREFVISDNCGGIPLQDAMEDVFCFGHHGHPDENRLGVYGIGLKRAIFKLGDEITVESHTDKGGFSVNIDVPKWAEKDDDLEDWKFPLKRQPEKVSTDKAGTVVTVSKLHPEVVNRIEEGTLENSLRKAVAQTYATFISRHATVKLNGAVVEPRPLPFGQSELVEPGVDIFEHDGVKITLLASVAPKSMRTQEYAGWYVLCNGRTVVAADKTELTGWGATSQAFHSKFLAFAGLASFTSNEPVKLPWTTTKRGLNRESPVYQFARNRMGGVAEPVLRFLTRMYPSDLTESPAERLVAETVKQSDFRDHFGPTARRPFHAQVSSTKKQTVRVQFDAHVKDLDRVKKRLRSPSMTASAVGKYTFDHFLKVECPE